MQDDDMPPPKVKIFAFAATTAPHIIDADASLIGDAIR